MKTEINSENKAKFFAQYMFQHVLMWHDKSILYAVDGSDIAIVSTKKTDYFLLLKPLSLITDEDAIEVCKIMDFHDGEGLIVDRIKDCIVYYDKYNDLPYSINTLYFYHDKLELFSKDENSNVFQYDSLRINMIIDFLRSKGYALPWNGLSVEEMVEAGWIKLNN